VPKAESTAEREVRPGVYVDTETGEVLPGPDQGAGPPVSPAGQGKVLW